MKRIGLITTLDTNIGDDFIREGICRILREVFKGDEIEFVPVNKHNPFSVYPFWHPIHLRDALTHIPKIPGKGLARRFIEFMAPKIGFSSFDSCDLIVQCGAPVFWPNCSHNEWATPLWKDIAGRLHESIPILNLAAGSCYPWERQPLIIDTPGDDKYLKAILGYCRLTTVRDHLSQRLCKTLSYEVPLIPCSAFLVGKGNILNVKQSGYILINYMSGGGHYAWDQEIDDRKWEDTVKTVIARLSKRHKMAFLCHDEKEFALTKKINSELPVYFPKSPREYLTLLSESAFAICNRMHASIALAGIGIPSIAVCTDTRLLMVSQIGLPTYYVKDVNADMLEEATENGINDGSIEKDRLLSLQNQVWDNYITVINKALRIK
ncbi:MAG: hypothetical protein CVU71_02205 [Deltaproteobacteria bacterium HGW-Deltaproteobacteria-6]|jgi:polysaccharide pyruvyl transferase WcaK-like protein|nr:MAG: hypothetical protein CVU71_02205 [Deltaproteobacteria bacterium HGW-Deltaproteobacteria-6]